nr:hypothetical protein [Petrachloros mirabilis]
MINVIALFMGLMTFSVLLGPALHLSPLWPTGVIVVSLSLVTLDTARWNAQGTTLLLDWWAQRWPQHRQRVLHHEAGHFLVAYLLDIPITGYALSAWETWRQGLPGQGGVWLDEPAAIASLSPSQVEHYCTVWMAGQVAEALVYGTAEGGKDDQAQAWALLTQRGVDPQSQVQQATRRARELLRSHWSAYQALIAAMGERASVSDCQTCIQHAILSDNS